MHRNEFEELAYHQKELEHPEVARKLNPTLPTLVRLDGRAFHTFTQGLNKPYDDRVSKAMIETTKYLIEETQASAGYTQSDEITLIFPNQDSAKEQLFGGKIQKLCSVLASMATAKFNQQIALLLPEKANLLPIFDARVWQVPDLVQVHKNLIFRESDAKRNSLSMAVQAHYSPKELHKAGHYKKHSMLFAKGVSWNAYPEFFKKGTYLRKEQVLKVLAPEELSHIPEKYRPNGPVLRSEVVEIHMQSIRDVPNAIEVLCFGAKPFPLPLQGNNYHGSEAL